MHQNPYEAPEEAPAESAPLKKQWRWRLPASLLAYFGALSALVSVALGFTIAKTMRYRYQADSLEEYVLAAWPAVIWLVIMFFWGVAWLSSAWTCWHQQWAPAVAFFTAGAVCGILTIAIGYYVIRP